MEAGSDVYNGYFKTINKKFLSLFDEIRAVYNFDNGDEFEIALCKVLRHILPLQYGICRGVVFNIDGKFIGDDIIIFDQQKFPTLRLLDDNNYAQKQHIPIEAVVAYIEAKHTIVLADGEGNSLNKALKQATAIKRMGRTELPLNPWPIDYKNLPKELHVTMPSEFPQINNPLYTCVFSFGARERKGGDILSAAELDRKLNGRALSFEGKVPDLLVFNSDLVAFPLIGDGFFSPFYMDTIPDSHFRCFIKEGMAWGIAMSLMFHAFERVRLGKIDWRTILTKTLGWEERK
jgi:hypothetical protein